MMKLSTSRKKKHRKVTGKRLWRYEYMKMAMDKQLILKISKSLRWQNKAGSEICKIVSFCYKPHYALLQKVNYTISVRAAGEGPDHITISLIRIYKGIIQGQKRFRREKKASFGNNFNRLQDLLWNKTNVRFQSKSN